MRSIYEQASKAALDLSSSTINRTIKTIKAIKKNIES